MSVRVAVLASGSGSNLQAILDHADALGSSRQANVVLVASDRADAGALARARQRNIAAATFDPAAADAMEELFRSHHVALVALAGYVRFVPVEVTTRWSGRIVNVHPALLPAFGGKGMYGARVHDAVIRAGARISGATAHFVDAQYDHGPIIAQWPVPVLPEDDAASLGRRILAVEHRMYPRIIEAVAGGEISLGPDGRVRGHLPWPGATDAFPAGSPLGRQAAV